MIREYPTNHFRFFGIRKGLCRIFGIIGTMGFSQNFTMFKPFPWEFFGSCITTPLSRGKDLDGDDLGGKSGGKGGKRPWLSVGSATKKKYIYIYIYTIPGGDCYWLGDTSNEICSGWVM